MTAFAIELAPDVDAFTGGVVLGLSVVLIAVTALAGLSIVRRILGA